MTYLNYHMLEIHASVIWDCCNAAFNWSRVLCASCVCPYVTFFHAFWL